MIRLLTVFLLCLQVSSYATSQQNCLDSIQTTKIVRLINDYKACVEYSEEIEERLITARELLSRVVQERDEYARLFNEVDSALKKMTARKEKLERKLKRTRQLGIGATIVSFLAGVLVVVLI